MVGINQKRQSASEWPIQRWHSSILSRGKLDDTNKFSKTSSHFNHHPYDSHIEIIKKDITDFAMTKWKENFDMVLVGHYHQTGTIEKNNKSLTFLGDRIKKFTVTKIDKEGLWQGDWENF